MLAAAPTWMRRRSGARWRCDGPGMIAAAEQQSIFAANRSIGHIAFSAMMSHGRTRRARVSEKGALRVRCPGPAAEELEAVLVNTAGGLAGGDRFELAFSCA